MEINGYEEKEVKSSNEKTKLTKWNNEPDLRIFKEDFENARTSHNVHTRKVEEWLDNYYVRNKAKVKTNVGRSSVQPQLIRKQGEWRYAALSEPFLDTNDMFKVVGVTYDDVEAARQNSLVLNNQFRNKINRVFFVDEFVRRAVNEGTVVVKVGWEFKEEEIDVEKPTFSYAPVPPESVEEIQQQVQEMQQTMQEHPDTLKQMPVELQEMLRIYLESGELQVVTQTGEETVQEKKTTKNQPSLEVCKYSDIIIDPSCEGNYENAKFVIHTFTSSYSELKDSGLYTNLDTINTESSSVDLMALSDEDMNNVDMSGNSQFTFKDKPRRKLKVYEYWGYWDIHGNGVVTPIVATWIDNVLIRLEENPYPDKEIPFVVTTYMPVVNNVYGEPDGALLEDHQKIVGAVTRGMIDLLGKSANSQTALPMGFLSPGNQRKYEKGDDYYYNPGQNHPANAVYQHKYPEIPNSAMSMLQIINGEAEALTGVKAFSTGGGITGKGMGDTAAGVRSAMDAASKRELAILRRLSKGMIDVGRKIIAMNAEFLEEEEVVRITNEEFIPIRKDDLKGNFDLELTISTAESDKSKAEQLAFMLQTMGNNMNPDMSKIILGEVARLNKMPDLAESISSFEPQPDPMQQQMQELQMQLLQAQIELTKAQAMEAGAKSQVQASKVAVEEARAENLQGDADNRALKFKEDYEGISHQRDIEKELVKQDGNARNQAEVLAAQAQQNREKNEANIANTMIGQMGKDNGNT